MRKCFYSEMINIPRTPPPVDAADRLRGPYRPPDSRRVAAMAARVLGRIREKQKQP